MRHHLRIFGIAKWTGVCLCVLILVAWGVSLQGSMWWGGYHWVRLQYGNVGFGWVFWSRAEYDEAAASYKRTYPGKLMAAWWIPSGGYGLNLPFAIGTAFNQRSFSREVYIPLWIPFLTIATLTVFAFRRSRRPPPGHCQTCGYDLTGNVSGICPECGKPVPTPTAGPECRATKA